MDSITESEVAGLGVGALLVAAAFAAPKVDSFIAKFQRRAMRLCEECGGVQKLPCKKCKGRGQEKKALFSALSTASSCDVCRGSGQLPCPSCSKAQVRIS